MSSHLHSLRRQRGSNPFVELFPLALVVGSIWLSVTLGKQYLGAAWWLVVLYVTAAVLFSGGIMAVAGLEPRMGALAVLGVIAIFFFI